MAMAPVARKVAGRSVYIKVVPPPTVFAERRAILHSLKQRAELLKAEIVHFGRMGVRRAILS